MDLKALNVPVKIGRPPSSKTSHPFNIIHQHQKQQKINYAFGLLNISNGVSSGCLLLKVNQTHTYILETTYFLLKRTVLICFLMIMDAQNHLHISFGTPLVCIQVRGLKFFPQTQTFLTFYILLHIKSEPKVIQNSLTIKIFIMKLVRLIF